MTALADQLANLGLYPNSAEADAAITAGDVYQDGNGQVRVAGVSRAIVADAVTGAYAQVAALQISAVQPREKGTGVLPDIF